MKIQAKLLLSIVYFSSFTLVARSVHRPVDPLAPQVTTYWGHDEQQQFQLVETHINETLFKHFDHDFFMAHLLPTGPITFRYDQNKSVNGAQLAALIEEAVEEILQTSYKKKPKSFKKFKILKTRDVDPRNHTGLYVLRFNNYPFIVKLFIETPSAFVEPMEKGFEPTCFFYMGGGVGRHIAGFTRIKNLEEIKHLTAQNNYWRNRLDFPRKWFWQPKKQQWLMVEGKNIGPNPSISMKIPAIYAVICDEIIWDRMFTMNSKADKNEAIALSNYLNQRIDLHINNFGIEYKTGKLTLIDFEHFPTVVGLNENEPHCTGYLSWYTNLSMKMLKRMMFRNKAERRALQFAKYCYPNPIKKQINRSPYDQIY